MTTIPSQQHMITTPSGIRLWAETFGDCSLPPLLLIMGAMNQGILWFDEFCTALAGKGYRVIRYDHRDTGASSVVNFTTQPYDLTDLTADATHLLTALAGAPAHIVGLSMGGYIGQLLALDQPQRVRSLTLIATPADFRAAMTPAIVANPWELGQTLFDYGRQFQASLPWTPQELLATPVQHWRMLGRVCKLDWGRRSTLVVIALRRRGAGPRTASLPSRAVSPALDAPFTRSGSPVTLVKCEGISSRSTMLEFADTP